MKRERERHTETQRERPPRLHTHLDERTFLLDRVLEHCAQSLPPHLRRPEPVTGAKKHISILFTRQHVRAFSHHRPALGTSGLLGVSSSPFCCAYIVRFNSKYSRRARDDDAPPKEVRRVSSPVRRVREVEVKCMGNDTKTETPPPPGTTVKISYRDNDRVQKASTGGEHAHQPHRNHTTIATLLTRRRTACHRWA